MAKYDPPADSRLDATPASQPKVRPCRRCFYWVPLTRRAEKGECHCNPPTSTPDLPVAFWPLTKPDDWCGASAPVLPKE